MSQLTWEYLFNTLEGAIKTLPQIIDDPKYLDGHDMFRQVLERVQGLYAVLPRLRSISEMDSFIPYMAMMTFIWQPTPTHYITLDTAQGQNKYHFILAHNSITVAETTVSIEEVIKTFLGFIEQAKQDMEQSSQ
jgi:hypothetical protein